MPFYDNFVHSVKYAGLVHARCTPYPGIVLELQKDLIHYLTIGHVVDIFNVCGKVSRARTLDAVTLSYKDVNCIVCLSKNPRVLL